MMMNAEIDQEDNKKDDTQPVVKYDEDNTGKWSTRGKRIHITYKIYVFTYNIVTFDS